MRASIIPVSKLLNRRRVLTAMIVTTVFLPVFLMAGNMESIEAVPGKTDFNGDGYADLAIGVPGEDIGVEDVGAVNVIYGSSGGLSATSVPDQRWYQGTPNVEDSPETGDQFGSAIATGDFNSDGFTDLAIGVPLEDVGAITDAGQVNVIYGSASGLSATSQIADQVWRQDSAGIDDTSEANDKFGSSLATGDFNNDGYDDLAVGVPFENVGSVLFAGAVNVIYGSASGLSASTVPDQFWNQDSPDFIDAGEDGDVFGYSLATGDFNNDGYDDLAIGAPGEGITRPCCNGAVNVIYGSSSGLSPTAVLPDQFWNQNSPNVEDTAESTEENFFGTTLATADFNGDGFSDLAIGAPQEDMSPPTILGNGVVHAIYGSASGLSATLSLADSVFYGDASNAAGSSIATANFNSDAYDDLVISVPGINGAYVLFGSSSGPIQPGAQFWAQDSADIQGTTESGDEFGSSLAAADFNNDGFPDLVVGVPFEDFLSIDDNPISDAGCINVIYGSSGGLSATSIPDQLWQQDDPSIEDAAETDDNFGHGLASS